MKQGKYFFSFAVMGLLMLAVPLSGHAQVPATTAPATTTASTANSTCTTFTQRAAQAFPTTATTTAPATQTMLLSNIYCFMKTIVSGSSSTSATCPTTTTSTSTTTSTTGATQKLFEAFTGNSGYSQAVYWALVLMVLFYGIGFTIGVVQPSFQQVLIRLVKMFFIVALIAPNGVGWIFFNTYFVGFFQDGTDDIIQRIQQIGFGIPAPAGATPFYALDRLAGFLLTPDTLVALMGSTVSGGPYGLTMTALMSLAMFGFMSLIIETLQVYAVCFVARALILGVAPIFIVFLLFDKTKGIFTSWLNALINLSLQPILLFTFLSFFLVLMQSAAQNMMGSELCWDTTKFVDGTSNQFAFWKFKDQGELGWNGSLECLVNPASVAAGKCTEFPIKIVDVLSFLILVFVATRFAGVVKQIASELSNAAVGLDTQGKLNLDSMNASANKAMGGTNTPAGGQMQMTKPAATPPAPMTGIRTPK